MASTIRISILADAANAVRGLRGTGAEANRTAKQLAQLNRQVGRLEARNVNISVKSKGFKQAVAEIVTANLALDRLRKGLPDLSFGLTGVANKFALVAAGALAATAAALPLVAATVAIGAALGSAVAGIGLFAAVAAPTFKAVTGAVGEYNTASRAYDRAKSIGDTKAATKAQNAMASSLNSLSPMQRAAAKQMITMNKAWETLSESTAPVVLGVISQAAGTLAAIIPKLSPAIGAMAEAFKGVSTDAFTGLAKSVGPFVDFVKNQGAPAFKSMATIIGNLLVTVGHIATAFAPLGNVILTRLGPITAAMRSINFDALAKSAAELLPLVGTLLGNLGEAVGNLVKAAAPLAGPVLAGLGDIAGTLKTALGGPEIKTFVANIAKIIPAVAPIAAVLITTFTKFAAIVSGQLVALVPKLLPIVQQMADVFVNVLTGLSPLLPALLDLVGVLISFLPVLFPVINAFREAMIPVVRAVSAALVQLRPVFAIVIGAFTSLFKPISAIITALVKIVPVLITALVPAFVIVANTIGQVLTAFTPLFPVLQQVITAVADGIQPVFTALGDALPTIVTALGSLVGPLLAIAVAALPILPPISTLAVALLNALLPAMLAIVPVLVTVAEAIGTAMPVAIGVLLPVFSALTAIVKDPAFAVLAGVVLGIVAATKLWAIAQAGLALVTKAAAIAQQAFQAVMNTGQLISFAAGMVKVRVATAAQAVAAKAAAIGQQALAAAQNAGQLVRYAAQMVATKVATLASDAATKAAAIAQGLYTAAMNSTLISSGRAAVVLVAAKAALIASTVATGAATAAQWLLNVALTANPIGIIILLIVALVAGLIYAYKNSETFRKIVDGAFRAVANAFKFLWEGAKRVFGWLKDNWKLVLAIITGPIGLIIYYVTRNWDKIRTTIVNGFNAVIKFFKDVPGKFIAAGKAIMQGLVDGIQAGLQWVKDKVKGLAGLIPDWLKSVLGIKSPSAVMAEVGTHILTGLAKGITSKVPQLKRTLTGIGTVISDGLAVSPALALGGLSDSVTASIKTGVSGARVGSGSGVPIGTATAALAPPIVVNVSVGPGSDPAEAGRRVVDVIEAYERRIGRRRLLAVTNA